MRVVIWMSTYDKITYGCFILATKTCGIYFNSIYEHISMEHVFYSVAPVSYTHLDVYKRQIYTHTVSSFNLKK